jgi:glycosyltransferase involved in cell wall biosynthesis
VKKVTRAASVGARQVWLWRNRSAFVTPTQGDQPRLLVDVSAILRHDAQTGIQRVVRAVWSELQSRVDDNLRVHPVYATNTQGYCYAPTDFLDRKGVQAGSEIVRVRPGDKFLGLDLSAHLLPKYRRQLKAWRAHGASIHLLVYDLLPLLRPDWFSSAAAGHFRRWFDVLRQDADQAICISDQVASDLREKLTGETRNQSLSIARLRMGAAISDSVPSNGLCSDVLRLLDQMRFRPTVLMVGTIEPRKGYDAAIAAFEHLWRTRPTEAPDLLIVGKGGWKTAALQDYIRSHPEKGKRLHWLDSVSDEGLCEFYEASRGVFMASRGEGFGLPLVEAAQHRRHVLARDLPVFREHRMSNVLYFRDDQPEALGDRLMDLVKSGTISHVPELPKWGDSVDDLLSEMGITEKICHQTKSPLRKAS